MAMEKFTLFPIRNVFICKLVDFFPFAMFFFYQECKIPVSKTLDFATVGWLEKTESLIFLENGVFFPW